MKRWLYLLPVFLFASILFATDFTIPEPDDFPKEEKALEQAEDNENFDKMMEVLTHKRCVNCHPSDNVPKQGEDSHPHYFGMARGEENLGYQATNCNTCHQKENNDFSGVPGAPEWSLAPESMKWEGLSRTEIAESMLDPKRNGGRTHHEVMEHLTEHELVLWAWTPGIDAAGNEREKPPVPKEEYIEAVKAWFEAGTVIPEK
jgi:hypothetical protein